MTINGWSETQEQANERHERRVRLANELRKQLDAVSADDRTPEWEAAHDMTDPRNQLPTQAERQATSAERMEEATRKLQEVLSPFYAERRKAEADAIRVLKISTAASLAASALILAISAIMGG